MRLEKCSTSLSVRNLDLEIRDKSTYRRHGKLLPQTVRSIVCGPSNCGKTNAVISLLLNSNGLRFQNVYVYSKSLFQPKYLYLKKVLNNVAGVSYNTFSNNCEVITVDKAKPNSIFVFDDIACDKQDAVRQYFCMGRHKSVDCFYLCQTYTRIPKHLIRDNANLLLLFEQDQTNLKHVFNDHVNTDMTFNQFLEACSLCWKTKYGFLTIDKDSPKNRGRYRREFDTYIVLDEN